MGGVVRRRMEGRRGRGRREGMEGRDRSWMTVLWVSTSTHSTLRLCHQTTAHLILMYNFHLPSSGAFSTYRSASTRLPLATHASTKGYTTWAVGCHWTDEQTRLTTSHACVLPPSHTVQ